MSQESNGTDSSSGSKPYIQDTPFGKAKVVVQGECTALVLKNKSKAARRFLKLQLKCLHSMNTLHTSGTSKKRTRTAFSHKELKWFADHAMTYNGKQDNNELWLKYQSLGISRDRSLVFKKLKNERQRQLADASNSVWTDFGPQPDDDAQSATTNTV